MFLNIAADNWALLWSAVIGAIIAGGAAAGVAAWVLGKTKEHQETLARAQLGEQREDMEEQLRQQREGLEMQIKEQRDEARLERRIAAASDLIAAVESLALGYFNGKTAVSTKIDDAVSACYRWKMSSNDDNLSEKIELAVSAIGGVALELADQASSGQVDRGLASNLITCKMRFHDAMCRFPEMPNAGELLTERSDIDLIYLSMTGKVGPLGYKGKPASDFYDADS